MVYCSSIQSVEKWLANAHDYQIFFERVSSSIYQVTNNLAEIQQLIHALGTREVVRAKEKLYVCF